MSNTPAAAQEPTRLLHLCDFDGTLTRRDSLWQFLWFAVPFPRLLMGGAWLVFKLPGLALFGKWSNAAAKAAVLTAFLGEKSKADWLRLGEDFCQQKLPGMLRGDLLERLRAAKRAGDTVAVVSASPDVWLRPFCSAEGFDLICTELFFDPRSRLFMAEFSTPNCNGPEKARRIREAYALESFGKILAYGNSSGDAAMFALADEVFRF